MDELIKVVDKLYETRNADREELKQLLQTEDNDVKEYVREKAVSVSQLYFGNKVYVRGLIEISDFCKNDCYYCGIRRSNREADRYRLDEETILGCCSAGYELGFRTFVMQGGEDPWYTDERMVSIISAIRKAYPDCAITLSIGEKSKETYKKYFDAGANRYLLRHETVNRHHYERLHPSEMSYDNRMRCLRDLKDIGFQTGCGFMIGSPFQMIDDLVEELFFIKDFAPEMIGIGPFIPHRDTPFAQESAGSAEMTLILLSILRLMNPPALIPATTALGTVDGEGREKGILAGANVIMPNLSPADVREKYLLYDGKICTGDEAAEAKATLERRMESIGYRVVTDRGDFPTDTL